VMSLFALYKNARAPTRAMIDDALSGNLCRCTGYRPIIDAVRSVEGLPEPAGWRAPGLDATGKRVTSVEERAMAATLRTLERKQTFDYACAGQRYLAPTTLEELSALRLAHPEAHLVAGATDVGLWITKQHRDLGTLIYTGNVHALCRIDQSAGELRIGAAVTLTDACAALNAEYPQLAEVWARFASVPIRNAATLGGNVANGSPIGDSMPALIALGARVLLRRGEVQRDLVLEDFYLDYRKTALVAGEFVEAICVPCAVPASEIRAYKVSKRFDQDISAVFACFNIRRHGAHVDSVRIGCGGVASTPRRALNCEGALHGRDWNDEATLGAAQCALDSDFEPISDMRASAAYRRQVLRNLLRRFWVETTVPSSTVRVLDYAAR
jgi:xanthine dehydrogenase small subunit